MNKPQLLKWKIAASLAFMAMLIFVSSASATLTTLMDNQNGASPFSPTWTVATGAANLLNGLQPTSSFGTFTQEAATGPAILTDGIIGPVANTGVNASDHAIFATVGNNGGRMAIYDLPAAANGYDITNITTFTAWGNGGRHAQAYTLYYSTKTAPRKFFLLGNVVYSGGFTGNNPNNPSANRVQWVDSAGASIAGNVAAIMFDFNTPTSPNGYNGYVGLSEITVQGTASALVVTQSVAIAATNETSTLGATIPFTPDWTLASPSLIAGMLPTTTNGNFGLESPTALGSRDVVSLTANGNQTLTKTTITANNNNTTSPNYVTCGGGSGAGSTIVYTLTNSANGSDVTNIVVYNGWADNGRFGQYYTVSYSTVAAPTVYIPISTIFYLPTVAGSEPSANQVTISSTNGVPLGSAVSNIKFDFASPPAAAAFNNGYQGYSQIIIQGNNTAAPPPPPSPYLVQDTLPTRVETFVGDQVVLTAAYSNSPPASLQWLVITNGVTNIISGATSSTLTLNNVQLTSTGSYLLKAVNATNGLAAPSYSTAAPLTVSTPATVGNVIAGYSGQTGPSPFYPAWTINTNSDLIFGFSIGAGNVTPGDGSFAKEVPLALDPSVLSDGNPNSDKVNMVSCGWSNAGGGAAGESMTYTLPTSTYGYNITNITIYGGWNDDGRNEQKYQVLYSTVGSSGPWVSIGTFDYNPSFSDGGPNATRTILVSASGALAQNVVSVQINFNMQSKNNWNGYSEITVGGTAALGIIPAIAQDIAPLTAEDVVGSQLTMTGGFSGATSYQWQKDGTNLVGQTSPTLTLSSLQFTNAATNGGYRLLGINVAGTNFTRGCTVVIDPAPVATNNIATAFAYQTSDAGSANPFTCTWDTSMLGASLIAGQNPPSIGYGSGNFNDPDVNYPNTAGGLPVLTDGNYGTFAYNGSHPAFATGGVPGSNAGQYVAYLLGANANGYDITNIQIAGGWNDNGRDSQFYTILYSTVSNPNIFLPLTAVAKNLSSPSYGVSDSTVVRTTLTPAAGVLASNVYAIEVDFQYPQGVPNAYSGYSEISVFGSPSATAPPAGPVITTQNEVSNNVWTVETPNLIAGQLPSSQGPGVFTGEGCNVTNMTDGILGFGAAFGAACGADTNSSVSWIAFTPTNGSWNISNIVVYTLWTDFGRDGQFYNLSYSTVSAPATFLPLASVAYNPFVPTGMTSGNRVAIAPVIGQSLLASNVAAVKFDFTPQGSQDFGWSGYTEIVLQGTNVPSAVVTPPVLGAPKVSGGNLILTGTGGTPFAGYTWLTTTNLSAPINWTTNTTGTLNGSGSFTNTIPIGTNPASFFRLRLP